MSRIPPELIGLDNIMEDFMAQSKRKNTLVVIKSFPDQRVDPEMRTRWMDAHIAAFAPKPRWTWDKIVLLIVFFGPAAWTYYEAMN